MLIFSSGKKILTPDSLTMLLKRLITSGFLVNWSTISAASILWGFPIGSFQNNSSVIKNIDKHPLWTTVRPPFDKQLFFGHDHQCIYLLE